MDTFCKIASEFGYQLIQLALTLTVVTYAARLLNELRRIRKEANQHAKAICSRLDALIRD